MPFGGVTPIFRVEDLRASINYYVKALGFKVDFQFRDFFASEMQIEDLDGNVLRIGSDTRKDKPMGDWLDMYGHRWMRTPDGRSERID